MYTDLQELFKYAMTNEQTLIFGNLGRLPNVYVDYIHQNYPHHKVRIVSNCYSVPIPSDFIRQIKFDQALMEMCDLLVIAEPFPYSEIPARFPNAGTTIIFTSHVIFKIRNEQCSFTTYFHHQNNDLYSRNVKRLLELQDGSMESSNINLAKNRIDFPSVVSVGPSKESDITLGGNNTDPPSLSDSKNYVIVNLSNRYLPIEMYVYFWDVFDYMIRHIDQIERWSICFREKSKFMYDNITQESINRLFCFKQFEPYLKNLLSLLPFYKSGVIDKRINVKLENFHNLEYVAPLLLHDALKANIMFDLKPFVGSLYRVV